MAELDKEVYDRYKKDAEDHAEFLCAKVFKPAFVMAFVHGAKHMFDEIPTDRELVLMVAEVKKLTRIKSMAEDGTALISNQGQAMDGFSELANYRDIISRLADLVDG